MTPTSDMVPSAAGQLAKTPLAHLFVFMAERKLKGSLVLVVDDNVQSIVYFASGMPAKVRTSYPSTHLGRVLLQLGYIDDQVLESTLMEMEQTGTLHGQLLLSMGAIDEAQLVAGLREQMMRRLLKIFEKTVDSGRYEFFEDANLLSDWGGSELTPIDPFRVVWEGMHMRPNDASIEPTLARLGQAAIGINPGVDFLRFGFGPPEAKTIDMLRALPMPLTQLQSLDVMPVRQLKLLLYVLLLTKGIALVATQSPTASPQPRQPSSPDVRGASMVSSQQPSAQGVPMARVKLKKSMSPVSSAVEEPVNQNRKMVLERAETIGDENYFEVLGITRTDPPDVARSAYFALAKVWHPDRLTGDMEDLREVVSRVFARMSEAFQTLSDPDKRAQYVDALDKGITAKEEQAQVQQVIEATLEFQKAEVFLRRKDLPNALKAAERAYLGDPEQASHVALFAWILAQQPEALQAAIFDRSLSLLEEAIKLNARCEQAYFYRAMLNKQLGNSQSALRDFKTVVELNPRNIDATRELRLATMRGGKASPPSDSKTVRSTSKSTQNAESINWTQDSVGDIIGKIFKKK